jgi:hypothetical protein
MTATIPELRDTDIDTIREWFASVVASNGGEGWHADDDPHEIINGYTGQYLFAEDQASAVAKAMSRIREAAQTWPDPNLLYDLAMLGKFSVEEMYPGFILDRSLISSRLGSVSIPDREMPNLVVEEYGQYALLEFPDRNLSAREQESYILRPIDKASVGQRSIDPRKLVVSEDEYLEFSDIKDLEEKVVELAEGGRTIRP